MKKGELFLIPSLLSETDVDLTVPAKVKDKINSIRHFIVEDLRTARRYLRKVNRTFDIDNSKFYELNKHTDKDKIHSYLQVCDNGINIGLITEAGCPGVADPGADIVEIAHKKNIKVIPLTGPSSIILAMMASGMNGQNFAFVGYLPIKSGDRIRRIKELESISAKIKQTQIFIETPYRNMHLLEDIINNCDKSTLLCIASDITGKEEFIRTTNIGDWKRKLPDLNKKPTIFLIHKA